MTEKEIEKSIILYIQALGGYAIGIQSGCIYKKCGNKTYKVTLAPAGTPDILACIKGKFLGIEVKKNDDEVKKWFRYPLGKKGKKLAFNQRNEDQKEHRTLVKMAGGIHIVCCSLLELEADLDSIGLI